MTLAAKTDRRTATVPRPSLLPFDPADLLAMRVLPAQFARMVGVSKQTVSRWVRDGKVSLGPDGRVDPVKASAQVLQRSDPARIRARALRDVSAELAALRSRVAELEGLLRDERDASMRREKAARFAANDRAAAGLFRVCEALEVRFGEASDAQARNSLAAWLDELVEVEFYGRELDALRCDVDRDDG